MDSDKAATRYQQSRFSVDCPIPVETKLLNKKIDPIKAAQLLKQLRQQMLAQTEFYRGFTRSLRLAFRRRLQVAQAGVLISTGFQVPLRKFDVALATMQQCYMVDGNALNEIAHLRPQMEPYEGLMRRRLGISLAL